MTFRSVLGATLLLGDGAMGTMIQNAALDDTAFDGHSGCNDVLNLTSPGVISEIHAQYLGAGADWIETNTFGANPTALADYNLAHAIADINLAGAQLARRAADQASTPSWPRYVVGSMGPGTKLPTLGQSSFTELRDAYQVAAAALIAGGVDALQVETCQDLLQAKAAIVGARRAVQAQGRDVPVIACVTIEANGAMLLGTPVDAAVAALRHMRIDALGLNCATGPDLMAQPLRTLSRCCPLPIIAMPNAGLPQMTADGLRYTLSPADFAQAMADFAQRFGLASVAGCCGTTPAHIGAARDAIGPARPVVTRQVSTVDALSSLYESVDVRQDVSYLAIGERANVSGSKVFRDAVAAQRWDDAVDVAKGQARFGAHLVDLCVDRTGGDGVADMTQLARRFATTVMAPIVLDSSKPGVLEAGLEQLPGRCLINSVNLEDGDGPGSKYVRTMSAVVEHGAAVVALTIDEAGLATTRQRKLTVASRLINDLTRRWGLTPADIFVDLLTYPVTTGAADTRRAAAETIEAIRDLKAEFPKVGTVLGISNVSFGLKAVARVVLNSVFLDECRQAGLDAAIVDAAKIRPLHQMPKDQVQAARDLIWDDHSRSDDPLAAFMALFDGESVQLVANQDDLAGLPTHDRLVRRIVDALPVGLDVDLDQALAQRDALSIVNDDLLEGMRIVGELFGAGRLQLPFVLASAEVMKKAVAHLEPALRADRADGASRGTLVLATVAGDVHDIGKNLVDIIVSNNGYKVVNLGVRVPIDEIVAAALREDATAIGLSGLLVKSAEVMRDNLAQLTAQGLADRFPVILGGAALSRGYVDGLRSQYNKVYYGANAFDGLAVLKGLVDAPSKPVVNQPPAPAVTQLPLPARMPRSDVHRGGPVPQPPFWGARQVGSIALDDVVGWLDERTLLTAQWGLRPLPGQNIDDLMRENRPRLDAHLNHIRQDDLGQFAVAYGYWPAFSEGDDVVLLHPDGTSEIARFHFPRQTKAPGLSIADYFRDRDEAAALGPDVVALQLVTMGQAVSVAASQLFAADRYREYLELHGLGVQLTEALAQMWHARVRAELGIAQADGPRADVLRHQTYQGERFSFGYPACPDLAPRRTLFDLVDGGAIGVLLSETFQLVPEQSTDAFIVHHAQARYFSIR